MKVLAKLIMLLIVLAVCVPANADILIYKKTLQCWNAYSPGVGIWNVDKSRIRGYFILEVNYNPDGTLAGIVDAAQVDYWRDRQEGKLYEVIDHDFDIIRVVDRRSVIWVFVQSEIDVDDINLIMLRGGARKTYIGSSTNMEAPKKINGDQLFYWDDGDWLITCKWSLRFYKKFTEWSNTDQDDLYTATTNIEAWLINSGYVED